MLNGNGTKLYNANTKFEIVTYMPEGENTWFRHNPSKQEQTIWQEIRTILEQDKKNFIPKNRRTVWN